MENEIDDNLEALHGAAGKLKGLAGAMGREVDKQNEHIIRITGKVSFQYASFVVEGLIDMSRLTAWTTRLL